MLAQCIPEDLCDRDYTHTIAAMVQAIMLLGCEGDAIDLLEERFDQVLVDCGTHLTINSELTVESGGMQISTMGVVQLTMTSEGENTASVTGGTVDTPLIDGQTREVTLSSANGYSVTKKESGDGYEYVIDTELMNPYTSQPDSK